MACHLAGNHLLGVSPTRTPLCAASPRRAPAHTLQTETVELCEQMVATGSSALEQDLPRTLQIGHTGMASHNICSSENLWLPHVGPQVLHVLKALPCNIPCACLSCVQLGPPKRRQDVHVIQTREETLAGSKCCCTSWMPKLNSNGMRGSPCSPPSCCSCVGRPLRLSKRTNPAWRDLSSRKAPPPLWTTYRT